MAIKKRERNISSAADKLANKLADKPYGSGSELSSDESEIINKSISLPRDLIHRIEDIVLANKRAGIEPKTFSAYVRASIERDINS